MSQEFLCQALGNPTGRQLGRERVAQRVKIELPPQGVNSRDAGFFQVDLDPFVGVHELHKNRIVELGIPPGCDLL
ncbi:hypothetical protein [Opitutus sp. ER46]|uniref:hypothetical protein n=1 Tax=Opitutus sp. ER46 TaxID=2161864 RepID=UPI001E5C9AE4|nr:hypothetical protein [Opitutus sp. ER46]